MNSLLNINNLTAGYGYGPDIVRDFSLTLNKSEVKCIIGPNGAGKSTLLKSIAGILKPRSGEIFFDGEKISEKEAYQIMRLGICFLPQERAIFPNLTVADNLRMCAYSIKDKKVAEARIKEAIEMFPVGRAAIRITGRGFSLDPLQGFHPVTDQLGNKLMSSNRRMDMIHVLVIPGQPTWSDLFQGNSSVHQRRVRLLADRQQGLVGFFQHP